MGEGAKRTRTWDGDAPDGTVEPDGMVEEDEVTLQCYQEEYEGECLPCANAQVSSRNAVMPAQLVVIQQDPGVPHHY